MKCVGIGAVAISTRTIPITYPLSYPCQPTVRCLCQRRFVLPRVLVCGSHTTTTMVATGTAAEWDGGRGMYIAQMENSISTKGISHTSLFFASAIKK